MTINIKITTLNGTRVYPVVANEQSTYPTVPTGLAVLRYIPIDDDVFVPVSNEVYVPGVVYGDGEEMLQYHEFTVECTFVSVAYVNIYAKKQVDSTYLLVAKKLAYTDTLDFQLLATDFQVGDDIDIKVEDYDNTTVYAEIEGHIYSTLTLTSYSTKTKLATNFTLSGEANCANVKVTLSSTAGEVSYIVSVVNGVWEKTDCSLLSSDGFVPNEAVTIKVEDNADALSYVESVGAFSTIATVTFTAITTIVADEDYDFEATTDGLEVEFFKRTSSPVGEWVSTGTATAVGGNCMLTTSVGVGTWDFKVEDTTDADGNDSVSDVVVESGESIVNYFVADWGNNRVIKKTISDMSYVSKVGTTGSGDEQFNNPISICLDNNNIFVSDSGNYRILKKTKTDGMTYVSKVAYSSVNGICSYICCDDEYVYGLVNNTVYKWNKTSMTFSLSSVANTYGNSFSMCCDDDYLYLIDRYSTSLLKKVRKSDMIQESSTNISYIGGSPSDEAYSIACDDTYIYLMLRSISNKTQFKKLLKSDFSYVSEVLFDSGLSTSQIGTPMNMECTDEHIYVSHYSYSSGWYVYITKYLKTNMGYISRDGGAEGSGDEQFKFLNSRLDFAFEPNGFD